MTIAILDYRTCEVHILQNLEPMDGIDAEDFLSEMGYNLSEIEWMSTDSSEITVKYQ